MKKKQPLAVNVSRPVYKRFICGGVCASSDQEWFAEVDTEGELQSIASNAIDAGEGLVWWYDNTSGDSGVYKPRYNGMGLA